MLAQVTLSSKNFNPVVNGSNATLAAWGGISSGGGGTTMGGNLSWIYGEIGPTASTLIPTDAIGAGLHTKTAISNGATIRIIGTSFLPLVAASVVSTAADFYLNIKYFNNPGANDTPPDPVTATDLTLSNIHPGSVATFTCKTGPAGTTALFDTTFTVNVSGVIARDLIFIGWGWGDKDGVDLANNLGCAFSYQVYVTP
jgi:hypothetical protein